MLYREAPECPYCGEAYKSIKRDMGRCFVGDTHMGYDISGHNKECKFHPLDRINIENTQFPCEGQPELYPHMSAQEIIEGAFKTLAKERVINKMATIIEARFTCNANTDTAYGSKAVQFHAVYDNDGANASFSKATPSGQIQINVDNDTEAATEFERGVTYKVTFERVEHGQ